MSVFIFAISHIAIGLLLIAKYKELPGPLFTLIGSFSVMSLFYWSAAVLEMLFL
ncbi:hypothetical protein [Domibacillus indicus]|uniref:hypothetical protein n=1 Tax=Domibacillus indicus TaxID=1437523 RepID=UPI000AE90A74|nr:hypothetical protein [Domibacillus indicus]